MMWKVVRILAAMAVSGIVTLFVTMLILAELGLKFHGNYEHYFQYPLFLGPAVIGFLAPGVLVWYMDRSGYERARKIAGTLVLMVVSGIVPLFVAGFMLLEFEENIHGDSMKAALWLGAYGLAIIGFLASGVIVWYLHKRGTSKSRSG